MAYIVLEKDATSTLITSGISFPEMAVEVKDLMDRFVAATGRTLNPRHIKVEAYEGGVCIVYRQPDEV